MTTGPATASALEFDPFSDTFFVDPYPTYKRMRDEAPVYYNAEYDFYALSRYDDVSVGQRDYETYSSAYGIDLAMVRRGKRNKFPMIIMMDPPEHRRMRSLVNRVFTPRAIMALEPMVRSTIQRFLDGCDPEGFDAVGDFASQFPVEIISTMLGVPEGERHQIKDWLDIFLHREPGEMEMGPTAASAMADMGMYYFGLIQQRRENPTDDMISDLVRVEVVREDGENQGETTRLDDMEIAGFLTLLGGAGAETVVKQVGNAIALFADHPEQWADLNAHREKIPAAAEEVLRFQAPSHYNVRRAMKDVTLHGVTIPEGAPVMMLVASANRDERAFPDADTFDIDRSTDQAQNIGFGFGIHSCLGAALARLETRVALELLLDFMPRFEIDRDRLERVAMTNVAGYSSLPTRRRN